ncbi:hypothetical protein EV122DRAFT_256823 [Schizophyllum commune]|nr:hypothetical protein K525DRAFT_245398 [Schizophyllum commune Loenen D]
MAESPQAQPLQSTAQSAHGNTRSAGPRCGLTSRPTLSPSPNNMRGFGLKVNSNSKSDILKTALLSKDHHFGTSAPKKTFEPGYGVRYQVLEDELPPFASYAEGPGKIRRPWMKLCLFPGGKDLTQPLQYSTHYEKMKALPQQCNITISKITHATRPYAAGEVRSNGASMLDTMALGAWSPQGSYHACYDRALPLPAMLGAASFNADCPAEYLSLGTSSQEEVALRARAEADLRLQDRSRQKFLALLKLLRCILLQDAAALKHQYPSCFLFAHDPLCTPDFDKFTLGAQSITDAAEHDARQAFRTLPHDMAEQLRVALSRQAADLAAERQAAVQWQERLYADISSLSQVVLGTSPIRPKYSQSARRLQDVQEDAMRKLEQQFSAERVRRHIWTWVVSNSRKYPDGWVPHYEFKNIQRLDIHGVWSEFASRLDGMLSVRELEETWGTRRRAGNRTVSTERSRRGKIYDLVHHLKEEARGWSAEKV